MKKHNLALAILATFGLAACGDDQMKAPQQVDSKAEAPVASAPVASNDEDTSVVENEEPAVAEPEPVVDVVTVAPAPAEPVVSEADKTAVVSFAARFTHNEVRAAYIGQTDWIDISVKRVPVASYEELSEWLDDCDDYSIYDCGFWDSYVDGGTIDNDNPSLDISLLPGNYVIIARPYTSNDGVDESQGRIVAFAELSSGAHTLPLYAMQANWEFDAPIDLMLLNEDNPFDDAVDAMPMDFDPTTDVTESAAEVLGLMPDMSLDRVHIGSQSSLFNATGEYAFVDYTDMSEMLGLVTYDDPLIPLLGQGADSLQDISALGNHMDEGIYDDMDNPIGKMHFETSFSNADAVYEYADGVTTHILELGEYSVELESEFDDGSFVDYGAGLFFVSDVTDIFDGDETEAGSGVYVDVDIDVDPDYGEPMEHEFDVLEMDDMGDLYIDTDSFPVVHAGAEIYSTTDNDGFIASLGPTQFVDGSTIMGYLVEYTYNMTGSIVVPDDGTAIAPPSHEEIMDNVMFHVMLDDMKDDMTGMVTAANDRSDMCYDLDEMSMGSQWTSYAYIDDMWQPGVVNYSHYIEWVEGEERPLGELSVSIGDMVDDMAYTESWDYVAHITTSVDGETVDVVNDLDEVIASATVELMGDYTAVLTEEYAIDDGKPLNAPTMTPGTDEALVYYLAADGDYTGDIKLHVWNDDVCDAYDGTEDHLLPNMDGDQGLYWSIPTTATDLNCVNFSIYEVSGDDIDHLVSDMPQMLNLVDGTTAFTTDAMEDMISFTAPDFGYEDVLVLSIEDGHVDFVEALMSGYVTNGDDLNEDGMVMPFETGVFYNNTCMWDDETDMQVCDDVDGDGVGEMFEMASTNIVGTGSAEVCVHPVTLSASDLDYPTADLGVIISSEK